MRSSILRRSKQVIKTNISTTRRTLISSTPKAPRAILPICCACGQPLSEPASPRNSQRRFQSSPTTSAAHESIKNNPIPQTHYEFFPKALPRGPPPQGPFHIDLRELRREFLQLQAVAHPDRHPSSLKTRAEATSARINEAYKTLQNPLLRAQYLLSLRGINIAEDETAKVEDPELLMEVLDTREEIEAAQEEGELEELKRVNDDRIVASEKIIEEGFTRDDIKRVIGEAVKLRYWVNVKESLDGWERGKPVVVVH